jgi:hypothetical protein
MKKTAVGFLMDKLFDPSTMIEEQIQWFHQAAQMEKEQIAYNSVRAIVDFQNNNDVELIEHPTELGSYHLRGEKEEVDKVLYGETFNTKEK